MVKIDSEDLLSVSQAAKLRGTTRQAINHLIRKGKLKVVDVAGKPFIKKKVLESFRADKGGRPKRETP